MILYHGTDYDNAQMLCNSGCTNENGLWCANDKGIALSYGKCIVLVYISEGHNLVDIYPLSTGKLTEIDDWTQEPIELFIQPYTKIRCKMEGKS